MTHDERIDGYGSNRQWLSPLARRVPARVLLRLPRRLAIPMLDARSKGRADVGDVRSIDMPPPFRLDTYWLRVRGDEGPAASIFVRGEEMLRLDCLAAVPHVHYSITDGRHRRHPQSRVRFPPGDMDAQIDRAVFELANNLPYSLSLDRRSSVRALSVEPHILEVAARSMGDHMRDLVRLHGSTAGRDT